MEVLREDSLSAAGIAGYNYHDLCHLAEDNRHVPDLRLGPGCSCHFAQIAKTPGEDVQKVDFQVQ
jgi:hypothetical protein